jgi:hypothetical protein
MLTLAGLLWIYARKLGAMITDYLMHFPYEYFYTISKWKLFDARIGFMHLLTGMH